MAKTLDSDLLHQVDPSRRELLKKLLVGTFAAPLISSFSMDGLSVREAEAGVLLASNLVVECLPPEIYFPDGLPLTVCKSDFHDTNAAHERVRVRARFEIATDFSQIAFRLQLSRRQRADALVIRAAHEDPDGVLEREILAMEDLSELPSRIRGVISGSPGCESVAALAFVMVRGAARLEIQLPDGSRLRGAIMPFR